MSRALKLFCLIGPLFFLIAVISFLWPSIMIKRNLDKVEVLFAAQASNEQMRLLKNRLDTFKLKLNQTITLVKSSLIYVEESNSTQVSFEKAIADGTAWKRAGQVLSYNNELGLLEINENGKVVIAIAPQNALLYGAKLTKINNNVIYALVDNYKGTLQPFIGVRPIVNLSGDENLDIDPLNSYFLYPVSYFLPNLDPKDSNFPKELRSLGETLAKAIASQKIDTLNGLMHYFATVYDRKTIRDNGAEAPGPKPKDLMQFYEKEDSTLMGARTRQFIFELLKNIDQSPFENGAPYGVAAFELNSQVVFNGVSVLTSDIFFEQSLLPESFQNHQFLVVDNPLLKQIFIGSTLDVKGESNNYTILLASSLSPILADLISNLESVAIISENGMPYVAINPEGIPLPRAAIENISLKAVGNMSYGTTLFDNIRYQFMQLQPFDTSKLKIIILRPESVDPIQNLRIAIVEELNDTTRWLALQLLGLNVAILIVALVILIFLSRAITKPLRQLATATEEVAKGHYSNCQIPHFKKNSHDEIAVLTDGFERLVSSLQDQEKMRGVLNKVVSKEIAAEILKGGLQLGGEDRVISVLFADIRNFTHMAEHLEPERLLSFLNKFMTKMSAVIEEHYGVIDKYVGDEIMALYGAPHNDPEHAKRAVETAILMIGELKKWNIERVAEGFPEIAIGIGISTGKMVAGNMGAENRLNYTVLGANVNLGARLCSQATPMQILINAQTLETCGLKEKLSYEEIPPLTLKGFSEPVKAYSVIGYKTS